MLMIARAQFTMKACMEIQRGGTYGQSLSDVLQGQRITQVSNATKVELIPVGVAYDLTHSGDFPVGRSSGLFQIEMAFVIPLEPEQHNSQCCLPQIVLPLSHDFFMASNRSGHVEIAPLAPRFTFWAIP